MQSGVIVKTRQRWTGLAGVAAALVIALGWSVAAAGAKKPIDWVALNASFAGATFVNDSETCRTCHEGDMATFGHTKHAKAFAVNPPGERGSLRELPWAAQQAH